MRIFKHIEEWRTYRSSLENRTIGFVPTMGALHEGHTSLVERSVRDNTSTVVSIFVNPTQFDQATDLQTYPLQLERDLELLQSHGVDYVLQPGYGGLYPDQYRFRVCESELSGKLCGAHREGHFGGVLTVVMRLFNIVMPDRAYLGEKDYQQLQLVKLMVEAFFMNVEVVACPTVREKDGLAVSSRNLKLDPAQRALAPVLYRTLRAAPDASAAMRRLRASGFEVDYVEDWQGRRLAAARLGEIRLIDNISLTETSPHIA